jgi:putative mycofactocin binding protein MftB
MRTRPSRLQDDSQQRSLGEHPTARSACLAAGVADSALPAYERALAALARSKMITRRAGP